jgi:hypothetical protein
MRRLHFKELERQRLSPTQRNKKESWRSLPDALPFSKATGFDMRKSAINPIRKRLGPPPSPIADCCEVKTPLQNHQEDRQRYAGDCAGELGLFMEDDANGRLQ